MKVAIVLVVALLLVSFCIVQLHHSRQRPSPLAPIVSASSVTDRLVMQSNSSRTRVIRKSTDVLGSRLPVDITGPLHERRWLERDVPGYPEWAEEEGLSGTVVYKIWVGPDGRVRSFVQLVHASGDARFDDGSLAAIRQWRAEAMPDATGDQWGLVTFHYLLEPSPPEIESAATLDRPLSSPRDDYSLAVHMSFAR